MWPVYPGIAEGQCPDKRIWFIRALPKGNVRMNGNRFAQENLGNPIERKG
jgi:hypothetical protein